MAESQPTAPPRDSWLDLVLYLVGGFGLFMLLSLGLGTVIEEFTLGAITLVYLTNVATFAGGTYFLGVRRGKISWRELGLFPPRWDDRWLLWALVLTVLLVPARVCLGLAVLRVLGQDAESLALRQEIFMGGGATLAGFVVNLLFAGLLIPMAEELFFRGLLYTWFRRRFSIWFSVLASALLFSLGHADSVAVVATSFVIGIVNALAYELTDSLWLPFALHALNNSLAVLLLFMVMLIA